MVDIGRFMAVVAVVVAGCVTAPKIDNTPVAALDMNRYLGEWCGAEIRLGCSEAILHDGRG